MVSWTDGIKLTPALYTNYVAKANTMHNEYAAQESRSESQNLTLNYKQLVLIIEKDQKVQYNSVVHSSVVQC